MKFLVAVVALVSSILLTYPAAAQDHPLLGSFEGATPLGTLVSQYDETRIITGPIQERDSRSQSGDGWKTVEGKVFHLYYKLPEGRTSLEALRNYEQSLKSKGFDVSFTCSTEGGTCFADNKKMPGLFLGLALDGSTDLPKLKAGDFVRNFFLNGNGRYLYATLNRPAGTVYVSLAFSDDPARGRMVFARVIESKEMETGKITVVAAEQINKDLMQSGRINIYGIQFDFDKATIRPDGQPQILAIVKLLGASPDLKLSIVGHTDNSGSADYNLDLSARRARAVVAELTSRYGITPDRLIAEGRGLGQPIASNGDEAGRALNRRVELIRR
jgi:OOP family OmpA-OmpF porin